MLAISEALQADPGGARPHPPAPYPREAGGAVAALGKSFYLGGALVSGGDVSGLDAILPCPVEGPCATRTTAGGSLRKLAGQRVESC